MPKYIEQLVTEQLRRAELAARSRGEEAQGEEARGPVITISRQLGSGGRKVAERLSSILEWSLWDKELVNAIARNASVRQTVVESFDEKTVSEIEVMARSIMGEHDLGGFLYYRHLARVVLAIGKRGNAVILGRGANFVLKSALNIRIHASHERRLENLMRFEGWTREYAQQQIRRSDRERSQFTKRVYGHDVADCSLYDIVAKTDELDIEGTAGTILTALRFKFPSVKLPMG